MSHNSIGVDMFSEEYIKELKSILNVIRCSDYANSVSYPFIPNLESNKKIAVVGLETKAWVGNVSDIHGVVIDENEIIAKSFEMYNEYKLFKDKTKGFGWLVNEISRLSGEHPAWLNFFAFSYREGSVDGISNKNKLKDKIRDFSVRKLAEEIKILNPDIIVFAGSYFNRFNALSDILTKNRTIVKEGFYSVELWDSMIVARVPHPSGMVKGWPVVTADNISLAVDLYRKK
ncbi:MAG: hypothetical protein ACRCZ3_03255 [Providencia rustigianii]|uniref:hypothetical protein n=1 Tax=Providencia rustigianii TaxID=158850 RepID=UPI003F3DF707